ncbi:MAG: histidine phosphatase family protein [Acidimicrobiia bacterium]|nr:histidine phosphatase family protein [Acidimicrobiia bacterium]
MTSLLVLRHGQSEWNAQGRWQGQADPPLTDLGRRQAATAARHIGAIDVVASSDLQRAAETAAIVAEHLGVGPVVTVAGLRERHVGEWEGLTHDEIRARWPGYLEEERRPPEFEPDEDFHHRIEEGLGTLADAYDGAEVLVVSHAGVIYGLETARGLPWERIPNLGGRRVRRGADGLTLGERELLLEGTDVAAEGNTTGGEATVAEPGSPHEAPDTQDR